MKYVRRIMLAIAFIVLIPHAYAQRGPGFGPGAPPLAMILLDPTVHASLSLETNQEAAWTSLSSLAQGLRAEVEAAHTTLASLVLTESAKNPPDLVAIESARVSADQARGAGMVNVANQAVALYATLNDDQKAKVVAAWQVRRQRMEARVPRAS
jgi:hypothetical protein